MYESMLDGRHEQLDFTFEIDGQQFDHLYYLVDGIYPSLSRFLLTINDPTNTLEVGTLTWDEMAEDYDPLIF